MPLIDVEDKQPDEAVTVRLRPEIARELRAYGEFAKGSSASHVVAGALIRLFRADKEFSDFLKAHPAAGKPPLPRTRKSAASVKGAA